MNLSQDFNYSVLCIISIILVFWVPYYKIVMSVNIWCITRKRNSQIVGTASLMKQLLQDGINLLLMSPQLQRIVLFSDGSAIEKIQKHSKQCSIWEWLSGLARCLWSEFVRFDSRNYFEKQLLGSTSPTILTISHGGLSWCARNNGFPPYKQLVSPSC